MKLWYMVVRPLVLVLVLALGEACSPLLSQESKEKDQDALVVNVPPEAPSDTLIAVVMAIDRHSGLVVLDSAIGRLLTVATPAQLHDLHADDLVLVRLDKADQRYKRPQDEEPGGIVRI